jgi:hypothetical protein
MYTVIQFKCFIVSGIVVVIIIDMNLDFYLVYLVPFLCCLHRQHQQRLVFVLHALLPLCSDFSIMFCQHFPLVEGFISALSTFISTVYTSGMKYSCDMCLFVFQIVSQCDAKSVAGLSESWLQ